MNRWRTLIHPQRLPFHVASVGLLLWIVAGSCSAAHAQGTFKPDSVAVSHYGSAIDVPESPLAWSITALTAEISQLWAKRTPALDGPLSTVANQLAQVASMGLANQSSPRLRREPRGFIRAGSFCDHDSNQSLQ